ncbi:MAG: tRNA (guanosine(37)-N1)-methyltransferase TrmD [Anaeroplasmataceae bacterium]
MKIKIVTLFPFMFEGFLGESIIKRAISSNLVSVEIIDLREYSDNKHKKVDDTPYGGGNGMVLKVDILHKCITSIKEKDSHVILLTPQGKTFNQFKAEELTNTIKNKDLIFICGHYEGFDERILKYIDEEISIGDFVLTGGELPSMVISDAVIRLLDGVIKEDSHKDDSISSGLLEYPQYTRPLVYEGIEVPEVLVNGNHKLIEEYRQYESFKKTLLKRPDLIANYNFNKKELLLLNKIKTDLKK